MEKKKEYLKQQDAAEYPNALIQIEEAVPCILHAENRTGEAILKRALNAKYTSIYSPTQQQEWVKQFSDMANERIWGKQETKCNWCVSKSKISDGTSVIGDQTMTNETSRLFIKHFKDVAELCFDDPDNNFARSEVVNAR